MNWLATLEPIVRHKDRRSPLYLRITDVVRKLIESGEIAENERLPADRELAKLLKIDRSTVARAYDQLASDGLVYSHVGKGTFVQRHLKAPVDYSPDSSFDQILWSDKYSRSSHDLASIVQRQPALNPDASCISFAAGTPTQEFFPQKDFQQILTDLLASSSAAEMFGYSQPEGLPQLREEVRRHLAKQGIQAEDNEILILSGSQQGIDLVARTLVDPSDVVLMEDPTYFWAMCTFTSNGARCLPVPVATDGIKLDAFENVASRLNAKLLYCMPSFQNPTGATMSEARRIRLLELARRYQVPILEDNFVGDLAYENEPPRSLRSLDRNGGTVIYQGTFSKALCPGLRLGWLVANEGVMSRLRLAKRTCDLSTNSMAQIILAEYLRRGLYEEHLQMVQAEYKERLDIMCDALDRHTSQWLHYDRPAGGMFLWATMPPGYSARELLTFAEREGVMYSPGEVFYLSGANPEHLRLTFIQQPKERIEEGIRRLAAALNGYGNSRRRLVRPGDGFVAAESTFI